MEAFTCLLMFKNFFSFGLTWSAYDWLLQFGISHTFYIIASVQVAVCLLTIPMCKLFLPRCSAATHTHGRVTEKHGRYFRKAQQVVFPPI